MKQYVKSKKLIWLIAKNHGFIKFMRVGGERRAAVGLQQGEYGGETRGGIESSRKIAGSAALLKWIKDGSRVYYADYIG